MLALRNGNMVDVALIKKFINVVNKGGGGGL